MTAVATFPRVATPAEIPSARPQPLDPESRAWLDDLRAAGPRRDAAVGRLHTVLLKAARFEVSRRRGSMPHLRGSDFDDVANQAADDALVSILARLDDYRGLSRFTTWAYKFALFEAGAKLRLRAWQGRELPLEDQAWDTLTTTSDEPAAAAEQGAVLEALKVSLDDLTEHQRRVFTALALNDVPIDVLADRLQTTRGALYKTLHDARSRLRTALASRGFEIDGRNS